MMFSFVGCESPTGVTEETDFQNKQTEYGAYSASAAYYQFAPVTMQLGERNYANGNYEFKVQNDDQSSYMIVNLEGGKAPAQGNSVDLKLSVRGISGLQSESFSAKVVKVASTKVWLWNGDKEIGLIIPR